jgi:hypothetical protein
MMTDQKAERMATLYMNTTVSTKLDAMIAHNHNCAVNEASADDCRATPPMEAPIIRMVQAWAEYGIQYRERMNASIGEDFYAGEYWFTLASSLNKLLSSEMGSRIHAGTVNKFIRETLNEQGFTMDEIDCSL